MAEIEKYRPWLFKLPPGGVVGKRGVRRRDGLDKASGKATYVRDVTRPGMLYAKFYLSPHAHAKIKRLDTSKAEAIPGVAAVLRYDDPSLDWKILPPDPADGLRLNGAVERNPFLLQNPANYYRQPCAALVIADREETCDRALKLLDIQWEELPFITDPEEALKPGATVLRPDMNPKSNEDRERLIERGDVEKGFAEADKIIEFRVSGEEQVWAGVEGQVQIAEWNEDKLEVWHHNHGTPDADLASYFGIDRGKIHTHLPYQGALFGGLVWVGTPRRYAIVASLAAKKVGRPVKLLMDESHFLGSEETCGVWQFKVGFKNDGTITAVDVRTIWNAAAYDNIRKIWESTKIPHFRNKASIPFVNRGPIICARHGGPASTVHHQVFSRVAAELNMDPTELALKNDGIGEGHDMAYANEHVKKKVGMDPSRDSLRECLEIGKKAMEWDKKFHAPGARKLPNGKMHGISFMWNLGWAHAPGSGGVEWHKRGIQAGSSGICVALKVQPDGTVTIMGRHGDGGWCGETAYCQVVADEVGLKYEEVTIMPADDVGFDLSPGGSAGGCLRNLEPLVVTSRNLKQIILKSAIQAPVFSGRRPEELDIKDGIVFEKANTIKQAKIVEVLRNVYASSFFPFVVTTQPPPITEEAYAMVRQCYFMEVEVDTETGMTDVTRLVVVNDVGKIINPDALRGQQHASYIGLGSSFKEAVYLDPQTGIKMNDNLVDYKVPLMNDFGSIEGHLIETGLGFGTYGMCGIGESCPACTRPMSIPAIYNAIGKWIESYPATPDKVLRVLGKI
jgi:CO/xanthine dehydrogenase Mo-binding subunit